MEPASMILKCPDHHRIQSTTNGALGKAELTAKLEIRDLDQTLRPMEIAGEEGISLLFRFDITVMSETAETSWQEVAGRQARLMFFAGDSFRTVHGIVERFEQWDEVKKRTTFRAVLVPDAWRLSQGRNCRIFQAMSVPAIIESVLRSAGLAQSAYRIALAHRYPDREYCVQYRESDWSFLSRLMEEEGIHYCFEHGDEANVLVIADSSSVHEAIEGDNPLPFRPSAGALLAGEHVSRFHYAERLCPGKVTLRDHNFKKANLLLESSAQAETDQAVEIYAYPGKYDSPDLGSHHAQVHLEALQAARKTGHGESTCLLLVPGARFGLVDHPRNDLNQEYLVTHVKHFWHTPAPEAPGDEKGPAYRNEFRAIRSGVAFRTPHGTRRPFIHGVQTATVVGPPGESIYTDEYGRVKVQFHWDRQGHYDEQSSCWVRVVQPWAG